MTTHLWGYIEAWRARQRFPVSQAALAKELGIHGTALSQWKHGQAKPTPKNLRRLSAVIGVPYEVLLDAFLIDAGYREEPRHGTQERQPEAPPMKQAAGSAAEQDPKPPTEEDWANSDGYDLAASRGKRYRPFDDQRDPETGEAL